MQQHYDNPLWVNTLDELFTPQTKWISIMAGRDCDTGILAFAYPEDRYGYLAYTQLGIEDVATLKKHATEHGMQYQGGTDDINCRYSIPGARWWSDPEWLTRGKAGYVIIDESKLK